MNPGDCRLANGTIVTPQQLRLLQSTGPPANKTYYSRTLCKRSIIFLIQPLTLLGDYQYPGQNGTFQFDYVYTLDSERLSCNDNNTITFDGKPEEYGLSNMTVGGGYCYNNRGYRSTELTNRTRCLPDTQNPAYRWGFSTMLSGVFVIVHLIWSLTMYLVWLDAQFNSKLVRMGYTMTPLRAAFTLATVARRKMGCGNVDLVRADTKNVEDKLFGNSSKKIRHQGAEIDYGLFNDDGKEGVEMMNDAENGLRQRKHGVTAFDA